MRQAPVVELLGPPASGKSSIAASLAALPGAVVMKDHERIDLAALAWSAVRGSPVLRFPPPAGVSRRRWIAWAGRLHAAPGMVDRRLRRGASVVLFDQGPGYTLGRLDSVRRCRDGEGWWQRRATECGGLLDVVVLLDADVMTLAQRLRGRGKAHVAKTLDDEETLTYLCRQREICDRAADALERAGTQVLRLDTDSGSVSEQVAAITAATGIPIAEDEYGGRG